MTPLLPWWTVVVVVVVVAKPSTLAYGRINNATHNFIILGERRDDGIVGS